MTTMKEIEQAYTDARALQEAYELILRLDPPSKANYQASMYLNQRKINWQTAKAAASDKLRAVDEEVETERKTTKKRPSREKQRSKATKDA